MGIKPFKIFLFLISILVTLLVLSFLLPSNNPEAFIRYPSPDRVMSMLLGPQWASQRPQANTEQTANSSSPDSSNEAYYTDNQQYTQTNDSLTQSEINGDFTPGGQHLNVGPGRLVQQPGRIGFQPDSQAHSANRTTNQATSVTRSPSIEYGNNPHALDNFFDALIRNEHQTGQIRVLHYADSQVEGDMVTSTIRDMLQSRFGGCGVGFMPACAGAPPIPGVKHSSSKGWAFHSVTYDKTLETAQFGILGGVTRIPSGSNGVWMRYTKGKSPKRNTQFNRMRLCLGRNTHPYTAIVQIDNQVVDTLDVAPNLNLNTLIFSTPTTCNNVKIELKGDAQALVYGVSMETQHGIFVDNIPVRGHSGTFFANFDTHFAQKFFNDLNTRLIIVQFGINVIPAQTRNFGYYENAMVKQLNTLKSLKNDASIVLIGVSDMTQNTVDGYRSNPNVVKVLQAQKNAARRAGVAFWNCYQAMGGENSMYNWATAKPALAKKDFIHFNYRGAHRVAKMFTNALLEDFKKYQQK